VSSLNLIPKATIKKSDAVQMAVAAMYGSKVQRE